MRSHRLLALAAIVSALASAPAAAHPPRVAGTPLLELYGQGIQRTLVVIPRCDPSRPPCDYRDTRFASWHVVLLTDGRASVSILDNSLEDAAGARAEAVLGPGDPSLLALVRRALADSRIGFAAGDCRASADFATPDTNDRAEVLDFDWRVTWYGRGNRMALLDLPVSSPQLCEDELGDLVDWLVKYAHSVRQAASP